MSDFWLYFKLGLEHVLDWNAYDHVLFLMVLSVPFQFRSWRKLLLLVTMFTLGHTISLLFSNYEVVSVSSAWIEWLIPITIVVTAIFNIMNTRRSRNGDNVVILYLATVFFGLIHGFGFGSFFKAINSEKELVPLLEFALGIEMAQIIVVLIVLIIGYVFQTFFRISGRDWILILSSIVIGRVIPMIVDNWIF